MNIFEGDCLKVMRDEIKKDTVNLVVVDLPYGQTACEWDNVIDLKKMWIELERVCTKNATLSFFCTTRFGASLIASRPRWFRYDLVWKKSRAVGFLCSGKMPLRKHEMIYIFSKPDNNDLDNSQNLGLREYSRAVMKYTGKTSTKINKELGHRKSEHFFRTETTQFGLPTEETYNELIEKYKINNMEGFREFKDIKNEWKKITPNVKTYNPQLTKGKPYKTKGGNLIKTNIYGTINKQTKLDNKGTRLPISVLEFDNPAKNIHPTQKPVALCEWLIKTYSNTGETVLDFTMGSGTTGIACINTNRHFIGIEKDKKIFTQAKERLEKYKKI
jgi:site-specific DNA-methyltransferase (adenine-specific)